MSTFGYLVPTRGTVQSSDDALELTARTSSDVVGLARRAEQLGFGSAWVGDSVLAKPRHEPLSTLAAIGAATDGIDLGTAVYLPSLRHPVNVAHQVATVDQLSGGRLLLGVGVSGGEDGAAEYRSLDVPFERRGARLNELLDVVRRLWGGERVDHDGPCYQLEDIELGFEPAGELPVYVATNTFDPDRGFPSSIERRIVEYGDGWLPIGIDPETYEAGLSHLRDALDETGRSPDALETAMYVDVVIDDDETSAIRKGQRFLDRYYPTWDPFTEDDVRRRGAFGPPATVAARLEEFVAAGAETIVVRFITADQRTQLRRFADLL